MPICRRCHQLYQAPGATPSPSQTSAKTDAPSSTASGTSTTTSSSTSTTPYKASTKHSSQCRYHPDMFVCRPHAADHYAFEINNQFMKDLEGWPAKFWDCCGAETPDAPGCVFASQHVPAYE